MPLLRLQLARGDRRDSEARYLDALRADLDAALPLIWGRRIVSMFFGTLASILSLPLQAYGKVLGALTFGASPPNSFQREDIKVASLVATHLALAIDRWQQSQPLEFTRQELARLASFPELNPAAIIELDPQGIVHYMNPAARQQFPEWSALGLRSPLLADLPALVEQIKERERQRVSLTKRLAALDAATHAGTVDGGELQAELREPLKEWRQLLRRQVAQGRPEPTADEREDARVLVELLLTP